MKAKIISVFLLVMLSAGAAQAYLIPVTFSVEVTSRGTFDGIVPTFGPAPLLVTDPDFTPQNFTMDYLFDSSIFSSSVRGFNREITMEAPFISQSRTPYFSELLSIYNPYPDVQEDINQARLTTALRGNLLPMFLNSRRTLSPQFLVSALIQSVRVTCLQI